MGHQITVSAHALVEITKPCKTGLGHAVLEAGACLGVLNGMKSQMILRKKTIRGIVVSLNIFSKWLQARKHENNERT